jgi:hypothetical protein
MAARGKTNLNGYLDTYWQNLQGYWKDGKVARDAWLMSCKKITNDGKEIAVNGDI